MGRKHESMLRKLERVLALTIACSFLLTGCGKLPTASPGAATSPEESVESIDSILSSVGVIEDLSFEVNRSAAAAIEYDGTETSVEVVDEKGLTWQLTIPENAIRDNCTITLTPLTDIKGEHKKVGLSGIMMEPDGLKFTKPATLTVTGTDVEKLFFLSGTQKGKNYTYQPAEILENGVKLSINHFSSEVASDVVDDPEVLKEMLKEMYEILRRFEKQVKRTLSNSIEVPDIMEIPLECYKNIPSSVYKQVEEYIILETKDAITAGVIMRVFGAYGELKGVNMARRLWLDCTRRILEKEKAFYDKYNAQPDKFIVSQSIFTDTKAIDYSIVAAGEEPSADVVTMYEDYISRKEKWANESAKYSIDKLRSHNYKYVAYAAKCMEYVSYTQFHKLLEEFDKAFTFELKIKIVYTQMYGDGETGIITSEGEGKMIPIAFPVWWSSMPIPRHLSGDVNISSTISGFYEDFKYSPTVYMISAEVKNWDPCETQSSDIWVSNLGLEEEELGYFQDSYTTFSEVLIWDYALDFFETELGEGFHAKLHNLEETAVEELFSGKDEMLDVTLDVFFELVHTPQ